MSKLVTVYWLDGSRTIFNITGIKQNDTTVELKLWNGNSCYIHLLSVRYFDVADIKEDRDE